MATLVRMYAPKFVLGPIRFPPDQNGRPNRGFVFRGHLWSPERLPLRFLNDRTPQSIRLTLRIVPVRTVDRTRGQYTEVGQCRVCQSSWKVGRNLRDTITSKVIDASNSADYAANAAAIDDV